MTREGVENGQDSDEGTGRHQNSPPQDKSSPSQPKDEQNGKPKLSIVKGAEVIEVDIPNGNHGNNQDSNSEMKAKKVDKDVEEQSKPLKENEEGKNEEGKKKEIVHNDSHDTVKEKEQDEKIVPEKVRDVPKKVVAPMAVFETIDLEEDMEKGMSDKHKAEDFPDGKTLTKPTDEVDAASVYSLFMEHDFRYYFQHPYCRIFLAYFVTFCNFLIYAEDPVAHSRKECTIPVIGNDFAFVCTRYPSNAWSLLKVFLWIVAIIVGCILGKIIHTMLFNRRFKLKMFSDSQGSWMTMFFAVILCLFIVSWLYNGFLMIGGDSTLDYRISSLMGIPNSWFTKAAACGTWCGDFFTAWMVTDIMLQEKLYPHWAPRVRAWWVASYHRIILFWVVTSSMSIIVIFVIATDYISWDRLNHDFLPTNEVSRAFLASFILVMDMLIVMQDWDFPHFISAIDIKLPGLNTAHIRFQIPKCMRKEHWQVHITGKWFNYGVLFLVLLLDLNMWKNQIFYEPYEFGQYVDSEGKIHTVYDAYSLETFNRTQFSLEYRNSTINPVTNRTYYSADNVMNTRYYAYPFAAKGMAFLPSLFVFVLFGFFIIKFGRFKPSKNDPYAGRLKRRRKRRLSARLQWRKLRNRIRTAEPILMYFRKRGQDPVPSPKQEESYPQNWEGHNT